jgi:D-alanyl-D-alanine carboxypeptidase
MKKINEENFNHLIQKMIDHKRLFSVAMHVENGDRSISWKAAAGGMEIGSRYFIASVTKFYVTAVVMQLIEENKISLEDPIAKYLPEHFCHKLHVIKGVDYSDQLTIGHLISNTSGLPDYFFHKQERGRTVADELLEGKDEPWPIERSIELIKELKPNSKPGAKGKAAYSDTNYQLLGRIIEQVTGKSMGEVFDDYVFSKLNLKDTYAYHDASDQTPVPFYYKSKALRLPEYMKSITPEGGIVSTVEEVMLFIKAFFDGQFFPKEKIADLQKWNLIFPPPGLFYYGIGLEKLWIPWIISPFKPIGDILGFWGQTGSFALYNPKTDLYFCGATNQVNGKGHRAATSVILKIIKSVL